MNRSKIFLAILILIFSTTAAWAEPASIALPEPSEGQNVGLIINASNAATYKEIIVPEFYPQVRAHALEFDAAAHLNYDLSIFKLKPSSLSNSNDILQANGALKSDVKLEAGLVFANWQEDKDELRRAQKILWNIQSKFWSEKFYRADFSLSWIENGKAAKEIKGQWLRVFPSLIDAADKSIQLFREKISIKQPAILKAFNWLTFRFLGAEEDMLWISSAPLLKVRQLTGSNRSDSIFNSLLSPDDFSAWFGKTELFDAIIEKELTALVPFSELDTQSLKDKDKDCMTVLEARQPNSQDTLKWNFETLRFPDALPWLPTSAVFIPRKLIRLELVPLDPFSLYGRQILYVDAELMIPYYKFVYNRSGYLWKTVVAVYGGAATKDKTRTILTNNYLLIEDRLTKASNVVEFSNIEFCSSYPAGFQLKDLDPQALLGTKSAAPTTP